MTQLYDEQWAKQYDEMARAGLPGYEAIHRITAAVFLSRLPNDARILVIGSGTGTELLTLGAENPTWQFVAVEPAEAMMAACKSRIDQAGMRDRVTFHAGFLESLTSDELFDGATSILVSQHLVDESKRIEFFHQISHRLKPKASLVTADLFGEVASEEFQILEPIWRQQGISSGMPEIAFDTIVEKFGKEISLVSELTIADYLQKAGFAVPHLIFRSLMYGVWLTQVA